MYDDSRLRNELAMLRKDFELLKNYLSQFRQTTTARINRIDNKVILIEEQLLPNFETADKIKRSN